MLSASNTDLNHVHITKVRVDSNPSYTSYSERVKCDNKSFVPNAHYNSPPK